MNYISIGDMARVFQLRGHQAQLKTTLMRLADEMSSGLKSDTGAAVRGDFTALAGIERSLTTLEAYRIAIAEASQTTAVMQSSLETVHTSLTELAPALLSAAAGNNPSSLEIATSHGREMLEFVISALNTSITGRFVFSGAATDTASISSAETILFELRNEIEGMSSAAEIENAVNAWFDAPSGANGYLDIAYLGSSKPLTKFQIGDGEAATLTLNAADPHIRNALKALALTSLAAEDALFENFTQQLALAEIAAHTILSADAGIALIQSEVGIAEGLISKAQIRNTTETSVIKIARSTLREADPYESATALEAVQLQLETLYLLTERLSRMRFTDYMR